MTELTHRNVSSAQSTSYTNLNDRKNVDRLRKNIEDRINDNEDKKEEEEEV